MDNVIILTDHVHVKWVFMVITANLRNAQETALITEHVLKRKENVLVMLAGKVQTVP